MGVRYRGLPRIRFSRVVWLILLSQVLSLAVVSSALWGFQKDLSQIPAGFGNVTNEQLLDTTPVLPNHDSSRKHTVLESQRFLGEAGMLSECMAYAFWASRGEATFDTSVLKHDNCDSLESIKEDGREARPPGGK